MTRPAPLWPHFEEVAEAFFDGPLARPRQLLKAFTATGTGSGRRVGPRALYWQTVAALSIAALEAGLEDLLMGAHARRQGSEGLSVRTGVNAPDKNPRPWLVEQRLMSPGSRKIEQALFADFGVILDVLPTQANFRARKKAWSLGGSGRGQDVPGATSWAELRTYLDTLAYLRNATAHGDAGKIAGMPPACEGLLWLRRQDGAWSIQQPHALTALRTVHATYNTAAMALASVLGVSALKLQLPDVINFE